MRARTKSESEKERRAKVRKKARPRTTKRWLRTRVIVRTYSKREGRDRIESD